MSVGITYCSNTKAFRNKSYLIQFCRFVVFNMALTCMTHWMKNSEKRIKKRSTEHSFTHIPTIVLHVHLLEKHEQCVSC